MAVAECTLTGFRGQWDVSYTAIVLWVETISLAANATTVPHAVYELSI